MGYVQLTHFTPGDDFPIIRVMPGLHPSRPVDLSILICQKELYFTLYVLPYAVKANQVTRVSNHPVPPWAVEFPIMRKRWGSGKSGKFSWLIGRASTPGTVEGLQSMQHVRDLTAEQMKLPINEIWSHPVLLQKLEQGWLPENDV